VKSTLGNSPGNSRGLASVVCAALLLAGAVASSYGAQQPPGSGDQGTPVAPSPQEMDSRPPPVLKGRDPKPQPAQQAILAAFGNYAVVGMPVDHGQKDLDDFILDLVRNPELPGKVNDIAVECGNSLYQPILDRYIAGEDIPLTEVQQVWRNTTQPPCGFSAFYEEIFPLVRQINQKLPPEKKLRVLACDPPIDWSKVKSPQDSRPFMDRDATIAAVIEKEILAKHRKGLLLFGTFHLFHGIPRNAVGRYEVQYPNVTWIITDHEGFGQRTPLAKYNDQLEKQGHMTSWQAPSLVTIKDTWLANLPLEYFLPPMITPGGGSGYPPGMPQFSQAVDAYLYLGPRDTLLEELIPSNVMLDKDYIAELQRRSSLAPGPGAMVAPGGHRILPPLEQALQMATSHNVLSHDPNEEVPEPAGPPPRRN
jgi:hypothetical protein